MTETLAGLVGAVVGAALVLAVLGLGLAVVMVDEAAEGLNDVTDEGAEEGLDDVLDERVVDAEGALLHKVVHEDSDIINEMMMSIAVRTGSSLLETEVQKTPTTKRHEADVVEARGAARKRANAPVARRAARYGTSCEMT